MYVIGKTGTGKSTLLSTLVRQDLEQGRGLALFDPHGDLVERALEWVPESRRGDLIYFNVPDAAQALAFNPLETVPPLKRPLAASGLLESSRRIGPSRGDRGLNTFSAMLSSHSSISPRPHSPTYCGS
jgi:DNA helicase HerA-like ATPase